MNEHKIRARLARIKHYINTFPIWSDYERKKIPMANMCYKERINHRIYNKYINESDKLVRELLLMKAE